MKKKVFAVLTAALIATGAFGCINSDNVKNNNETTEISQNSTSEAVDFAKVNSAKAADLFDDVESKIQNILNDGSEYAVYL
ncbi:MAG: hypothetical protein IJ797_06240, partial [Selenomonadaceae bacterium]|nr:hypothetical protein [Selenomonadaceae bacterium]